MLKDLVAGAVEEAVEAESTPVETEQPKETAGGSVQAAALPSWRLTGGCHHTEFVHLSASQQAQILT